MWAQLNKLQALRIYSIGFIRLAALHINTNSVNKQKEKSPRVRDPRGRSNTAGKEQLFSGNSLQVTLCK
jgi:hypothetical protein